MFWFGIVLAVAAVLQLLFKALDPDDPDKRIKSELAEMKKYEHSKTGRGS